MCIQTAAMFAKQFTRKISSVVSREVSIPVAWGEIAAKQWTHSNMTDDKQGQHNIILVRFQLFCGFQ